MKKYGFYPIIILFIISLSVFMPKYYKKIFATRTQHVTVAYSPVDQDFIKTTHTKDRKTLYSSMDESKMYSMEQYEEKLPFAYYYYLVKSNRFPKEIPSFMPETTRVYVEYSYFHPMHVHKKRVNIFPLFESKPDRYGLKNPKDVFGFGKDGLVFIDSNTLKINVNKNKTYNDILLKQGAVFPIKKAYGNSTTLKTFDEGYFMVDAKDQLFHVKRADDKPVIHKIDTKNMKTKYMLVKETLRKEIYGIIVDTNDNIYVLMYGYKLIKLPIDSYNSTLESFNLKATPTNRIATLSHTNTQTKQNIIKTYVMDTDYKLINKNKYTYSATHTKIYEIAKDILFTFQTDITLQKKYYGVFEITRLSKSGLIVSFVLSILYLLFIAIRKKYSIKDHLVQAILICFGGLYSIIALFLFDKLLVKKLTFT